MSHDADRVHLHRQKREERQRLAALTRRLTEIDASGNKTPRAREAMAQLVDSCRARLASIEQQLASDDVLVRDGDAITVVDDVLPSDQLRARLQHLDLVITRNVTPGCEAAARRLRTAIARELRTLTNNRGTP